MSVDDCGHMGEVPPTRNVRYLLDASRHCGHDVAHWLRYLRKFVRNGAPALSPSEVEYLSNCGDLSLCQRVVLERGMETGTPTFGYLRALNEPARTPMVDLIRAELHGDMPTNPHGPRPASQDTSELDEPLGEPLGERGILDADRAVTLERLATGRGIQWLRSFYVENEAALLGDRYAACACHSDR